MAAVEELSLVAADACAAVAFSGVGEPTGCVSDCIVAAAVAGGLLCLKATSGLDCSAPGDDVSRAFVVARVCCSPLRNRRHASEPCVESAGVVVTAGF